MKYVFLLLTLIILSGSFGFSLAKGKGFEGGFPESSGLGNYRIGNMGAKREPEPEIQYEPSEEKPTFKINQGTQIDQRKKRSSNNPVNHGRLTRLGNRRGCFLRLKGILCKVSH